MSIAPTILEGLDAKLLGNVVTPADSDWDTARSAWNLAVDQRPTAVVFAAGTADVQAVIHYAAAAGLRVTAQATGHLASAVGDLVDTILIRTELLDEVTVDAGARTVRVGSGVTWGQVNAVLENTGLAALAGSSHDVGVAGYTLGGGYSWLSRSLGLAASAVTAIDIVLPSGEPIRATADDHAELFWAVRGGGGAFGIVTALEFRLFPIADVYAGMLLFPIERTREILNEFAVFTTDLDERATTCVRILRFPPIPELPDFIRGKSFVGIDGAIDAPDAAAEALLAQLRSLDPQVDTFARIPTTALESVHMDPATPVPVKGDGLNIDRLDAEVIDALLASTGVDADSPLLIVDIRHLGGAIGRVDPAGGAVDHLDGGFLVFAAGFVPVPEAALAVGAAIASVRDALAPYASERDYSNFREDRSTPERIWPAAVLDRLVAVKAAVDPTGIMRSAHPLSPGE